MLFDIFNVNKREYINFDDIKDTFKICYGVNKMEKNDSVFKGVLMKNDVYIEQLARDFIVEYDIDNN